MPKPIEQAVLELDPDNVNHWTTEGLPRIETLKLLTGDSTITRDAINTAAPNLTRETLAAQLQSEAEEGPDESDTNVVTEEEFDELEDLVDVERTLVSVKQQISAIQTEISERQAALTVLIQREADLDNILTTSKPKQNMNPEIAEYLAAQTRHEQDKAAKIQALRESGAAEFLETFKALGV